MHYTRTLCLSVSMGLGYVPSLHLFTLRDHSSSKSTLYAVTHFKQKYVTTKCGGVHSWNNIGSLLKHPFTYSIHLCNMWNRMCMYASVLPFMFVCINMNCKESKICIEFMDVPDDNREAVRKNCEIKHCFGKMHYSKINFHSVLGRENMTYMYVRTHWKWQKNI